LESKGEICIFRFQTRPAAMGGTLPAISKSLNKMKLLISILIYFWTTSLFGQNLTKESYFSVVHKQLIDCDSTIEIFVITEVMSEFPGGKKELTNFIKNTKGKCDKTGKVFVSFVIENDGTIHCVKVLRGISESCNAEAIRIVKAMPNWTPGMQRNEPVESQYTLPIEF